MQFIVHLVAWTFPKITLMKMNSCRLLSSQLYFGLYSLFVPVECQAKILLFSEMRITRKIFTLVVANLFFLNRFSGDIIFSSLVSYAFFVFLFVFLLVCLFFEMKNIYLLIHIQLCGRVSDKKNSLGRFPEARLLYLALSVALNLI